MKMIFPLLQSKLAITSVLVELNLLRHFLLTHWELCQVSQKISRSSIRTTANRYATHSTTTRPTSRTKFGTTDLRLHRIHNHNVLTVFLLVFLLTDWSKQYLIVSMLSAYKLQWCTRQYTKIHENTRPRPHPRRLGIQVLHYCHIRKLSHYCRANWIKLVNTAGWIQLNMELPLLYSKSE